MGIPVRTCVACRRRRDQPSMIRLVSSSGLVTFDAAARLPGRGAYLCRDRACLDQALRRGGAGLHRALRQRATVDEPALRRQFDTAVASSMPGAAPAEQQSEVSA